MNKKIIGIFVIGIFIFSGIGSSTGSIFGINENIKWNQNINQNNYSFDELDQSQQVMDFFAPVGNIFLAPEINYITGQSFIPTKNVLTRVEILTGKNSSASHDFILAIRDDILGSDLTSLSLPPEDFVTENFSWLEFDFEDIYVTPGITYYIVCSTQDEPDNWYAWGAKLSDVYPNGTVWWSEDNGVSFEEDADADLSFKTYGLNNLPPGIPSITGPTSGKPGSSYTYTFTTGIDPDGDDVSYFIDWGDNTTSGWTSFIPSGPPGYSESHSWTSDGTYTIKAKAKDEFGAESDWGELSVKIPRDKSIHAAQFQWLYNFLQTHLNQFLRIRHLFSL